LLIQPVCFVQEKQCDEFRSACEWIENLSMSMDKILLVLGNKRGGNDNISCWVLVLYNRYQMDQQRNAGIILFHCFKSVYLYWMCTYDVHCKFMCVLSVTDNHWCQLYNSLGKSLQVFPTQNIIVLYIYCIWCTVIWFLVFTSHKPWSRSLVLWDRNELIHDYVPL
jgi:hypothetical protein